MGNPSYNPVTVGVNATVSLTNDDLGGFLAATAGTITVVDARGVTIISAHPVAAGSWYDLPFYLQGSGATFTTAGGASGTIAVA